MELQVHPCSPPHRPFFQFIQAAPQIIPWFAQLFLEEEKVLSRTHTQGSLQNITDNCWLFSADYNYLRGTKLRFLVY